MGKPKTRAELRDEGILLEGPIVPEWFKALSDGCSIPGRFTRWLLRAKMTRSVCLIHDLRYMMIDVMFEDATREKILARSLADRELQSNRRRLFRVPLLSRLFARAYYSGVHIGGVRPLRSAAERYLSRTTPGQRKEVYEILPHRTKRARGLLGIDEGIVPTP